MSHKSPTSHGVLTTAILSHNGIRPFDAVVLVAPPPHLEPEPKPELMEPKNAQNPH